jgi:hypothetical protein
MADLDESFYGDYLYGGGYYSYKPIWLFDAAATIQVSAAAELIVYAFRKFAAAVTISVSAVSKLGMSRTFHSPPVTIPINVVSNEYIGMFWNPDVPIDDTWIPDVPVNDTWAEASRSKGPWEPFGPDMRPNWDG